MKIVAVDIDGVLTKEEKGFGDEVYMKRTPVKRAIEILKDYKRRGFKIILHSSRHHEDIRITRKWLATHRVPHDEIILGKPKADVYIDNRMEDLDREVLLASGGVDSTIAFFYLQKPQPIYFKLGHRYQRKEMRCLINLSKIIKGFNVKFIEDLKLGKFEYGENAYIPHRNLLLALMASNFGNKIYLVGIKGDRVPDKSPEAYEVMSFAINFIQKPDEPRVKVVSPFWSMTKVDIIKWFINEYGKDYAQKVLQTSVSCYDEKTLKSCGKCASCFRKSVAMAYCGLNINFFENDITKWQGVRGYIKRLKEGIYDPIRTKQTIKVLKKWKWL